jgi:hypothetical protein
MRLAAGCRKYKGTSTAVSGRGESEGIRGVQSPDKVLVKGEEVSRPNKKPAASADKVLVKGEEGERARADPGSSVCTGNNPLWNGLAWPCTGAS